MLTIVSTGPARTDVGGHSACWQGERENLKGLSSLPGTQRPPSTGGAPSTVAGRPKYRSVSRSTFCILVAGYGSNVHPGLGCGTPKRQEALGDSAVLSDKSLDACRHQSTVPQRSDRIRLRRTALSSAPSSCLPVTEKIFRGQLLARPPSWLADTAAHALRECS